MLDPVVSEDEGQLGENKTPQRMVTKVSRGKEKCFSLSASNRVPSGQILGISGTFLE